MGVADSVDSLIEEHQSIDRALVQIKMPRMKKEELEKIIDIGLKKLEMTIDSDVKNDIVSLSQGLPHYIHLLSLYTSQTALMENENNINNSHLEKAIDESINKAQQTIRDAYYMAVSSPRGNLYKQVLLACALAKNDEMGYFTPSNVMNPLKEITGKSYEISAFSKHLKEFRSEKRGEILKRIGYPRRYRYRFKNPMMESFVILKGRSKGLIKKPT